MKKKTLEQGIKPSLSWTLADYNKTSDEPPICVYNGITEGQTMDEEEIEEWAIESFRILSVLKEEYPDKYNEQYQDFVLNLEYLHSLGKITKDEVKELTKEENFNFGK